jgi:lipopolysaccharide transport system ATP-binding protein
MPPAISVEAIGKRYELGERRAHGARLSEQLMDVLSAPFRGRAEAARRDLEPPHRDEHFWALRDISLTIDQGQVVGLIGPNGAGKSTLLKLMARITAPTTGRIVLRGRVGTLLEVGTGFHPDLTGRENVFLNGSILGLTRREIAARFDDIVEFAEVTRFIDTPVKRYSSGMYVRLAFAVAAHLDPEILLVDEVLSVGDEEFQRKCIGALRAAAAGGRTVVFVSHSMEAVKSLCSHAYLIESGRLVTHGPSDVVVRRYLDEHSLRVREAEAEIPNDTPRVGNGKARFRRASVMGAQGHPVAEVHLGEQITLAATVEVFETIPDAVIEFGLSTPDAIRVASMHNIDEGRPTARLEPGLHEIRADVDVALIPGQYALDLHLSRRFRGETVDLVERVVRVQALPTSADGAEQYPFAQPRGSIRLRSDWNVIPQDAISSYPARG